MKSFRFFSARTTLKSLLSGLILAMIGVTGSAWAQTQWAMDPSASVLGFEGTQMGAAFTGSFVDFSADIVFDPDDPAVARVAVVIRTGSAVTGSADRDAQIGTDAWFASERFPEARFVTSGLTPTGGTTFDTTADLSIRDKTRSVSMPVSIVFTGSGAERRARAEGELTIDRTQFDVGTGDWATGSVVGTEVRIFFEIEATPLTE